MEESKRGWSIVSLFCLLPVLLWLTQPDAFSRFSDLSSISLSIGQLTALVGVVAFSFSFVLSMRIALLEDFFGGMNRVYQAHHILGGIAFILLLIHPLLMLYPYSAGTWKYAAALLIPGSDLALNLGLVGLATMMVLLILTYYVDLPYGIWRFTHKYLGAAFFMGALHGFLMSSDISRYPLLWWYMISMIAIGTAAFTYRTLLGKILVPRHRFILERIRKGKGGVSELILRPVEPRDKFHFIPGQFVFISLKGKDVKDRDPHPFSISSSPHDETVRVSIKALGDYTSWVKDAPIGSEVLVEGPYGRFSYYMKPGTSCVWVAGGIGITPFVSMSHALTNDSDVDLYYCVTDESEATYMEELKQRSVTMKNFRIIPWYSTKNGRLSAQHLHELSGSLVNKDIFICGPPRMMFALKQQCVALGVPKKRVRTEEFEIS